MVKRVKIEREPAGGGLYFPTPKKSKLKFIQSGCSLLDNALGGGWIEDRVINIVGDRSTGKTLLAAEACANFFIKHPKGTVRYAEAEAAFDEEYAAALGIPVKRIKFTEPDEIETVEDFYEDFEVHLESGAETSHPTLYILDSLDALSSRAEMKRKIDDPTFGGEKAKKMSELFRKKVRFLRETGTTLIIISQIRDRIGVVYGKKYSRTGGKALDFYASQIVYLASHGIRRKKVYSIERAAGLRVSAHLDKNKVGLPFRTAEFEILFGFGIDDVRASVDFLIKCGKAKRLLGITSKTRPGFLSEIWKLSDDEWHAEVDRINSLAREQWYKIDKGFLPPRQKY